MTDMLTITDVIGYNNKINLSISDITNKLNAGEITTAQAAEAISRFTGYKVNPIKNVTGTQILGWEAGEIATVTTTNPINSNVSTVARGSISAPISTSATQAGKLTTSRLAGVGSKVMTVGSKIAVPLALATVACSLGKTIDEAAYAANPDFWESIGAYSVNPQTWSSIAGGDGTFGGSFINMLFGIDPQTEETQPYINADAMAYLAYCMQLSGVFSVGTPSASLDDMTGLPLNNVNQPIPFIPLSSAFFSDYAGYNTGDKYAIYDFQDVPSDAMFYCAYNSFVQPSSSYYYYYGMVSPTQFTGTYTRTVYNRDGSIFSQTVNQLRGNKFTVNNRDLYISQLSATKPAQTPGIPITNAPEYFSTVNMRTGTDATKFLTTCGYIILYGDVNPGGLPGIGDQPGATIPNFSGLSEGDYLPYLQQTYPDMFNNAITYPVIQPDGTVKDFTYVPVTLPETSSITGTQPTTGTQTQTNPAIDPSTAPIDLVELVTKLLQQPIGENPTDDITPPENPTETGSGENPPLIVPVGSATSLWKIYHPTQAQVDSFGGWLWSSNFIDQILKIFNNPMEAVIGLHKVYATPIDAGTTTIKVGYLDSQVSSAYIEQQYIEVDCGSITLDEEFGNALDYTATTIKLYLPFVGIVSLDVNEVMRSTISITYGVDMITGACLAMVSVSRDGFDSVLYQYAGNCAVQYPISSGSYMGIVSSIIGVAGSIAATVASGGSVAPLAIGAMGAAFNAHTSVQNSGSFSGNAGAMGGKIPYLIIERGQSAIADNFESFEGIPANQKTTIGECTGFVKAKISHVNVEATDTEIDEIIALLAEGILV